MPMPTFLPAGSPPSPGQIDAARRILAHPAKRAYGKGSAGTTVRALKIFLKFKGFDPGPINGRWDQQMQRAAKKYGIDRATPAALKKISSEFGPPGPRPPRIRATPASMSPVTSSRTGAQDFLREALGGGDIPLPVYSGLGEAPGAGSTGQASKLAAMKDRQLGDLMPPEEPPPDEGPDAGSPMDITPPGLGPGSGVTDPYQQGFGEEDPLQESNSDYIPPMPPGGAEGGVGDLGAEAGGPMDWDPSALQEDQPPGEPPVEEPPAPGVPPDPAQAMQNRELFNQPPGPPEVAPEEPPVEEPPAPGVPPDPAQAMADRERGLPPGDPALLGRPPLPPTEALPTPDEPPIEGGLTAEDLVPPDASAGSPMPQALGGVPDATTSGDLGDLTGAPPVPDDMTSSGGPGALPPLPPATDDTAMAGELGDLPPSLRAPDSGMPGNLSGYAVPPSGGGMPGDLSGYAIPPDDGGGMPGDLSGYGVPHGGGGRTITIKKGDTLWDIAEREYGDPKLWPIIAKSNPGIKNPDLIYYGRKLVLPAI